MAIEFTTRCLAMNLEKRMAIDKALFRWIDLDFSSWVAKSQNGKSIISTYKIEEASDWNPHEKRFPNDLGSAWVIRGATAAAAATGSESISPTDVIEDESEKNS
jgi:hypothetical protein